MAFFRAVKTPESPRSYLPKLADALPPAPVAAEERESKVVPRYVEIPALRERGFGPRNLFWGLGTLFLALAILVVALFFAGPKATVSLLTALRTFTVLFVLARLHVFRQRNGGFLALAIVCLLGGVVPLIESGFTALKGSISFSKGGAPASSAATGNDSQVPLLSQSFALTPPDGNAQRAKILKDTRVNIGDRTFLIKAGEQFTLLNVKNGQATFAVRDLEVTLPTNIVDVVDPIALMNGVGGGRRADSNQPPVGSAPMANTNGNPGAGGNGAASSAPEPGPVIAPNAGGSANMTPKQIAELTAAATETAKQLYPALAVRDSFENMSFVAEFQKIKNSKAGTEFFGDPEWPLVLAQQLARRDGWVKGARPMTVGPSTTEPAAILDGPVTGDKEPAVGPAGPADAVDNAVDAGIGARARPEPGAGAGLDRGVR